MEGHCAGEKVGPVTWSTLRRSKDFNFPQTKDESFVLSSPDFKISRYVSL